MCQVASTDTVIRREYTYSDAYGIHVINVRAFNLANNDTVSASVDVLEWQCEAPTVSVDPLFTDQNTPFITLMEDGFTVTANFTVSCTKNEKFNARWEILDSAQQNVLTAVANASQLVSASNALPAGAYVIRINMTMWSSYFDLSDKTVISYAYVNIERCQPPNITVNPLFANASDPYHTLVEDGFTVTIDYSFDCEKLEQFNIRWDILDSTELQTLSTLPNATELISLPNGLALGSYVIRINMTIFISFFDLSDKTVVSYAYVNIERCQPPNITVNPLFASESDPYHALVEDGFTVTIDYSFDCAKLEQFNIRWDILDSAQQTLSTLPNATELTSLPNALLPGSYVIRINMTIFSSFFDLSHKAVVAYAYVNIQYCQPTNVTLNPMAESSDPFSAQDVYGFTVTASFFVDCPPMEKLNADWDILDSSQLSVLRTERNATQLTSLPYGLPVGVYVIRVNTTIWSSIFDLSEKTVISFTYVSITLTSLAAGIDGSSYINATFNSTVFLSAYNQTFASHRPPSDKSGMVFEWRCRRSNETWPIQLPTQSYVPYNGTSGCFGGVGPGVLGFAAGLWSFTIDTGYLEPLTEYSIHFLVWKDLSFATAEVSLYVQQPLAPSVSIRLV